MNIKCLVPGFDVLHIFSKHENVQKSVTAARNTETAHLNYAVRGEGLLMSPSVQTAWAHMAYVNL
jgi:hypothetical protein